MSAIMNLVQGSPEWRTHRASHRNASETPAVLGVSPWVTPYQLWLERTGRVKPEVNAAMWHGTQLEPAARAAYERLTGHVMEPLVLADGSYSASLDGITLDGRLILEIKCPFQGRDSELWKMASAGDIPEHYHWQIEHQLMVSGAALAHVYVFVGTEGVLLEQRPRQNDWAAIRQAWDRFMRFVAEDRAPALADRDTVLRTDPEWAAAARVFLAAKETADAAATRLDEAKSTLVMLAQHPSEKGAGVLLSRYRKAGTIDYKKVAALAGMDLEQCRGAPREEVRISATK